MSKHITDAMTLIVLCVALIVGIFIGRCSMQHSQAAVHRCEIAGQEHGCLSHSARWTKDDSCRCVGQTRAVLYYSYVEDDDG
jgi:hypothetical protein